MIRQHSITYLTLAAAVGFWGFSFIATKIALQGVTPFCLIFIRFFLASLFFCLILFGRSAPPISQDGCRNLGRLGASLPPLKMLCGAVVTAAVYITNLHSIDQTQRTPLQTR